MSKYRVSNNQYFIVGVSGILAISLVLVLLAGCVAIPRTPPRPQIQDLPPAGEEGAIVVISRKHQFTGGYAPIYLFLDGLPIVKLDRGQYTKFLVSPGGHSLSIQWEVGGIYVVAAGPYGGGAGLIGQAGPFQVENQILFESTKEYLFTIEAASYMDAALGKIGEDQRFIFRLVDKLDEPFVLESKKYIPPGKKQ